MTANIYNGGVIGARPANSLYPYPSGLYGIGEAGLTYDTFLQTPPAILNSADVWLDAADLTTITEVGGAVSQWDNKGVTGGNFTQGTAALQPTTGSTTLNNQNVIDFANDHLRASTPSDWTFLNNGTTYLILAVFKSTSASSVAYAGTNDGNWFYTGFSVSGYTNGTDDFSGLTVLRGVGSTFAVLANSGTGTVTQGNWYLGSYIADPDNATASARASIFLNGGSAVNNNTQISSVDTGAPDYPLEIGSSGNGTYDFIGSLAELIILRGSLATETNRVEIRNYLNGKWAVY